MAENQDKHSKDENEQLVEADDADDMEDMDGKAKALTNLLKTSSVSVY